MFGRVKKIVNNPYTLSVIAKICGVLVGFIFTVFQSRYLGAEIKGQVAKVNSIVAITAIVFGFGIYHAYPYFKRNTEVDIMPIFMKLALIMLGFYGLISVGTVVVLDLSPKWIAVMIITPLLAYDQIVSYITLIEVPNKRSLTDIAVVFSELALLIILWIFAPPSFAIGVIVIAFKDVVKAMFFTAWWRKRIFVPSESLKIWAPRLIKFGFFPMLSLLMTTLNYRVDVIMLDGKVTDAAIGIYSVGVLLAERIWMVPDAMQGVMVSKLTKGKDAHETAFVLRVCNAVCLIVVLGLILLGEPFMDFVFGAEYHGAYEVTLILLAGVFSMIYYKVISAYNIAMGKQFVTFILLTIGVVSNVIANLFLIPPYGIYGAGWASVISYAVCAVLFITYFCKETGIPFKEMIFINKEDYAKIKRKLKKSK